MLGHWPGPAPSAKPPVRRRQRQDGAGTAISPCSTTHHQQRTARFYIESVVVSPQHPGTPPYMRRWLAIAITTYRTEVVASRQPADRLHQRTDTSLNFPHLSDKGKQDVAGYPGQQILRPVRGLRLHAPLYAGRRRRGHLLLPATWTFRRAPRYRLYAKTPAASTATICLRKRRVCSSILTNRRSTTRTAAPRTACTCSGAPTTNTRRWASNSSSAPRANFTTTS